MNCLNELTNLKLVSFKPKAIKLYERIEYSFDYYSIIIIKSQIKEKERGKHFFFLVSYVFC